MGGDGRPLRFLMIVVGGWTGARIALLSDGAGIDRADLTRDPRAAVTRAVAVSGAILNPASGLVWRVASKRAGRMVLGSATTRAFAATARRRAAAVPDAAVSLPIHAAIIAADAALPLAQNTASGGGDAARPIAAALPTRSRWSGSAWALVRGAGNAGGVATPQLGGSQVGARIAYRLGDSGRVAAAARVAAALGARQQEAAVGLEWQPTRLPLRLVAEQRVGIAGLRGGAALGLVGGASGVPIGAGFRADGYAQAGVVARDRADGYFDAALVASRAVAVRGETRLELGLGAWGAAQRGAARLDLGPSAAIVLPVERRALRIGVQWRARVAGGARPGPGAVLSLGTDF